MSTKKARHTAANTVAITMTSGMQASTGVTAHIHKKHQQASNAVVKPSGPKGFRKPDALQKLGALTQ
jgi:hypothetical protein